MVRVKLRVSERWEAELDDRMTTLHHRSNRTGAGDGVLTTTIVDMIEEDKCPGPAGVPSRSAAPGKYWPR